MTQIAPSILSANFGHMAEDIQKIEQAGADMIHCDVMDGVFVPNITFGAQMVQEIRACTTLPMDAHLMIVEPQNHVQAFIEAGADLVTFHPETCFHPHKVLGDIRKAGAKAGIVLNPGTSVTAVEFLLPLCDMVLVMSVNPGWGGQAFLEDSLRKVRELVGRREAMGMNFTIEIDGGINRKTAPNAIEAGVDILVAGSAVFGAPNWTAEIHALRGGTQ